MAQKSNFVAMKELTIKKVETKREMNDFVNLTDKLYDGCPYYVPDLKTDVRATFDPKKNAGLEFTDIQPFIAYNEKGDAVGRIAGIINHRANDKWKTKNVRFGFFDFIDDLSVSSALLDAVGRWEKERGMDTLQGPMGITDFDKEGMLEQNRNHPATSCRPCRPLTYQPLAFRQFPQYKNKHPGSNKYQQRA